MKTCKTLLAALAATSGLWLISTPAQADTPTAAIEQAVGHENTWRTDEDRVRDAARKPAEVLTFFGVRPDMTIVENAPGGGWYSRIIGPFLKEKGTYYGAQANPELFLDVVPEDLHERFLTTVSTWRKDFNKNNADMAGSGAKAFLYGTKPGQPGYFPDNSVDAVLDIRSIHNLASSGDDMTKRILSEFFRVLKPGGTLGVIDHRADEDTPQTPVEIGGQGYVKESYMIEIAERAGFQFVAKSDLLSNPKDTKDHEAGVWSLPPTLRLGDKDKEKYQAIGESDRWVMKFVKPAE